MFRLFLPLYALIIIFVLFNEQIFEYFMFEYAIDMYQQDKKADFRGFFMVVDRLSEEVEIEEIQAVFEQATQNSNIPLYLIPRSELALSASALEQLDQGNIWVENISNYIMFRKLKETGYVVSAGPVHTIEGLENRALLISYMITLIFIGLILLWAFNFQRKLHYLNRITLAFGRGELQIRANISPWHRVGILNQTFNQMAQRVQDLIKSHKDLNNAVSHELRTPIARLSFEVESLRDADAQEMMILINGMEDDINELEQLVEELLNYARFERAHIDLAFEFIRFDHWLQNWHLRHRHHDPKPLLIKPPIPKQVVPLLPELLNRAIDNLVLNAYRYAHSQVQISAHIVGQQIVIHIDDDGIGIPEPNRATIFEPFVRVDKSRNRKTGGFGLGLSIVRQIARRHGGDVSLTDSPLGGARFSVFWNYEL
ncbi:ATP-binding protein [Candidatus Albibeggiatoa sp. nov. NOAA]|uniref:ATP-binding protein n=1 Tax=Candidatus Albibeggiatoa sp. nov. NOAA TaxID=3162724 RepID=UPI0032F9679B|nr:ATP-binding protein [Thiotrichaceae bacterium]